MTEVQFKQPKGVTLKQPAGAIDELFGSSGEAEVSEWVAMPDWVPDPEKRHETAKYPYDGVPVLLLHRYENDGLPIDEAFEAVWRTTRGFDMKAGVWKITGFWARRCGGQRLGFEPAGFRELKA